MQAGDSAALKDPWPTVSNERVYTWRDSYDCSRVVLLVGQDNDTVLSGELYRRKSLHSRLLSSWCIPSGICLHKGQLMARELFLD